MVPKQTVTSSAVKQKTPADAADQEGSTTFIHKTRQSVPSELTPLQRQRLDAAVMLLVNYLVNASSES
jgi:hypothetical protein